MESCDLFNCLWAFNEPIFVLMTCAIVLLLSYSTKDLPKKSLGKNSNYLIVEEVGGTGLQNFTIFSVQQQKCELVHKYRLFNRILRGL
jgi:hypothetical protein